jgi:hypothetical protein
MNHYLLYKMIYGRILEATCTLVAIIALLGTGVFKGSYDAWVFWTIGIAFIVVRLFITHKMHSLEDGLRKDK